MNKKGITTIELLICFVIVIVITMSMFSVVSSYNERRIIESYKAEITTYKNTLTKDIQDDLIKIGITGATYERTMTNAEGTSLPVKAVYTVNMDLRDGTKRQLVVEQTLSKSSYHPAGNPNVNDKFMIKYGDPNALTEYPLPELGSYEDETTHKTIQDFSINNVLINIYDEKVLSIYIGFYHPELGTRYCIEITALIDFTFTGAEFVDPLSEHFFIVYNLFGGTVSPSNRTSFDRRTETFTLNNPTKIGNTFTGWSGTGISGKKNPVTIEKGSSGSRTYNANWRSNRSCFYYDLGPGETLASPYTPTNAATRYYTVEDHKIMMSSDAAGTDKHAVEMNALYGGHINDLGLANYNGGAGTFDIKKPGYRPVSGKEWKCASGNCVKDTYDMTVVYNDVDICDCSVKDCFVTIQPNWEKVTYSIGYTLNGGSVSTANPTTYNVESDSFTLNNPTKKGYTFTGWTGTGLSSASTSVTISKGSTGNRTYTANWTPTVYTITYNMDGGANNSSNPSSYTIESNKITLQAPTKSGWVFTGWTGSNGTTPQTSVSIASGSTGNKTYTANWIERVSVTIHGALNETITCYKCTDSSCNTSSRCLKTDGSVLNIGTNSVGTATASLQPGYYKFVSNVSKKGNCKTNYDEIIYISTNQTNPILFMPDTAVYWYGNGGVRNSYLFSKTGGIYWEMTSGNGSTTTTSDGTSTSLTSGSGRFQNNAHNVTISVRSGGGDYYTEAKFVKNVSKPSNTNRMGVCAGSSGFYEQKWDATQNKWLINYCKINFAGKEVTSGNFNERPISLSSAASGSTNVAIYCRSTYGYVDADLRAAWFYYKE